MGLSFAAQAHTPVRWYFNPRAPCGARLCGICAYLPAVRNFNPRTPCGVRRRHRVRLGGDGAISIHAPLAGCDDQYRHPVTGHIISIHAPLAGCDLTGSTAKRVSIISIHAPLAGCDFAVLIGRKVFMDFNPRTPCGVRPTPALWVAVSVDISIHAPLAGCDGATYLKDAPSMISIHAPLAGCDNGDFNVSVHVGISIHAPLAGCDHVDFFALIDDFHFNPRTPCGVRRWRTPLPHLDYPYFNPRTPCGVRHNTTDTALRATNFNPRTPCGVRLSASLAKHISRTNFNPRTPCGVRQDVFAFRAMRNRISIHAPLAGCDSKFDEFLSANLHKSNKRDLLSEEKMRHSLPQTAHVSHFRSFLGAKLQRFSARLPFALRS